MPALYAHAAGALAFVLNVAVAGAAAPPPPPRHVGRQTFNPPANETHAERSLSTMRGNAKPFHKCPGLDTHMYLGVPHLGGAEPQPS